MLLKPGFTYDFETNTCKEVMMNACGRTNNGFLKLEECEAKCSKFFIFQG